MVQDSVVGRSENSSTYIAVHEDGYFEACISSISVFFKAQNIHLLPLHLLIGDPGQWFRSCYPGLAMQLHR